MAKRRKLQSPPSYRRRMNPVPVYLAVALVLILVFVVLSLTVLFRLETYEIAGEVPYTEEEIIAATGLRGRENLIRLDTADVEQRILASLPYVETVKVERNLPSSLRITCTKAEEYAFYRESGICYTVDRKGRVLAESRDEEKPLIRLGGVKAPSASLASNAAQNKRTFLTFDSDRTKEAFSSLADQLDKASLGRVTRINLPSYLEISFVLEERIRVNIGTVVEMDYKMTFAEKIFDTPDAVPAEGYVIVDVSNTERGASVKTNVANAITEKDVLG